MASENDKNHKVRVAQYLRMSTDHQQYSLHNQSEYIKDYAEKNNMEIAYTYDDAGKSGVSIIGRHSLQQLLSDVEQASQAFRQEFQEKTHAPEHEAYECCLVFL